MAPRLCFINEKQGEVNYFPHDSSYATTEKITFKCTPMADSGNIGKDVRNLWLSNKIQPFGKIRLAAPRDKLYKYRS